MAMKVFLLFGFIILSISIPELLIAQDTSVEDLVRQLQRDAEQKIQDSQYDIGLGLLNQAHELAATTETPFLRRDVLNDIANVYYQTGQLEQAERYYVELLEMDEVSLDQMALSVTLFNIGHVYGSRFQFVAADQSLTRSLLISQEIGDKIGEAFALKALGESAQAQQDYSAASEYLDEAQKMFVSLSDVVQEAIVSRHLGDLELENGNFNLAIEHYLAAVPVLTQHSMDTALLRTYRGLGESYEKSFILDKALIAHQAYTEILQFQLHEQNKEATQRLQVEFETRKFADENTELEILTKDQEQELQHRQELLKLQYVITGLVSAFMLQLGFLWWKSRIHGKKMHELATIDVLTGLFNRRAILEKGNYEWKRIERFKGSFCCLMLDIDHFKSINDTYGHAIGDEALQAVSKALADTMRESDLLGRFGGEEFLVFAAESNVEQAGILAERIRQNIMKITLKSVPDKKITVSIGVAEKEEEQNLDELIQNADLALYSAKETGRNKVEIYSAASYEKH